jgi:hypothetical protein
MKLAMWLKNLGSISIAFFGKKYAPKAREAPHTDRSQDRKKNIQILIRSPTKKNSPGTRASFKAPCFT